MTALTLGFAAGLPSAAASAANLRPFQKVCVNAVYEAGGQEDEEIAAQLITRIETALRKAKIAVVPGDCQASGTLAKKQLNLFYSFITTDELDACSGMLEGWLIKDGTFAEPTIWWNNAFGSLGEGSVHIQAADDADDLVTDFIADWKKVH